MNDFAEYDEDSIDSNRFEMPTSGVRFSFNTHPLPNSGKSEQPYNQGEVLRTRLAEYPIFERHHNMTRGPVAVMMTIGVSIIIGTIWWVISSIIHPDDPITPTLLTLPLLIAGGGCIGIAIYIRAAPCPK